MKKFAFGILLILGLFPVYAQNEATQDQILEAFARYSELPREVVYVHLNKSVFIKGEDLGFKAYVLDKDQKRPSLETRNLYCILADSTNRVVKSQLVRITGGAGHGVFELDSLFRTGKYTFRAYTNWMRNFSETNFFQQSIDILDPETHATLPVTSLPADLDFQILPEGGHAVSGFPTVYGVIIKDAAGYGVSGIEGRITDASGTEINRFRVNQFGIGRLQLIPQEGKSLFARFSYLNRDYRVPLPPAQPEGVTLRLTDLGDKVAIALNARFRDPARSDASFFLTLHNGDSLKGVPVSFRDQAENLKVFPKSDLYKGVNVFTLFDPNGNPMLERLYFNDRGLVLHKKVSSVLSRVEDSVKVTLGLGFKPGTFNSLSISVLPGGSHADRAHHNLPSYTLLQPYLRGAVQNANYYFEEVDPKKRYELDNLLLTQGWSSYDWNTVFKNPPTYRFDFEKGISYTVGFNSRKSDAFYVFPTYYTPSQLLRLKPGQEEFTVENFYPLQGEKLGITEIRDNSRSGPSGAFVRFKPSAIPPLKPLQDNLLPSRLGQLFEEIEAPPISFENLKRLQMLDEVVIAKRRRMQRLETLRDRTPGRIDLFSENDPRRMQFLSNYLSGRGFIVSEGLGTVDIQARNPNSPNNTRPMVYLDGVLLTDFDILWRFRLDVVDYIEVNPVGIGSGLMGGGGVIRIVTDPNLRTENAAGRAFKAYEIPLAFGTNKKFYTPVYSSYDSEFFRAFGTLGWFPDLRLNGEGAISFNIRPYGLEEVELHIEGIVNDNEFVSRRVVLQAGKK